MTDTGTLPHVVALSAADFTATVPALGDLLVDTVGSGASVGFLASLDPGAARAWWTARRPAVADGSLRVWVAYDAAGLAGTVSLAASPMPNGAHRGEIVKLMVHPRARGRGLARALLATAEAAAALAGMSLLLLDTETDSPAEHLYRSAGWTRYGTVEDYAADPYGVLRSCSFYSKRLDPGGGAGTGR